MGNKSAKKILGHADLEAGETVVDACYGLSKGVLAAADFVSLGGRAKPYSEAAGARTADPAGSEGAKIDRTGILCITDRRLLFFPVKTAITKPKAVAAAWPLASVVGATFERNILAVEFADGSVGGLHVPGAEHPSDFVVALHGIIGRGSPDPTVGAEIRDAARQETEYPGDETNEG
jgi:hypothetical protein